MHEINFADAQQALGFIQPQLLRIETQVYQTRYPSFDYADLMYVNTDGDMWDIGSIFYSGDIAGKAEFLTSKGFDMPFADVATTQFMNANHLAGIGYEWSLGELQRASKLGRSLTADKAMAANKVAEQFIYSIAMVGSAEKNKTGLLNDGGVPAALFANDGTGSSRAWADKDVTKVVRDFNELLVAPYDATKEVHIANAVMLPTSSMQGLAGRILDTASGYTLLKFIRENNWYTLQTGQPLTIKARRELETAGQSGSRRAIAYDKAREVVQFHLPGPHEFLPAFQKSSMTWEIGGIMNVGGTEIRLPKAIAYRDGL